MLSGARVAGVLILDLDAIEARQAVENVVKRTRTENHGCRLERLMTGDERMGVMVMEW